MQVMLNWIVKNPIALSITTGIITFIITWPINNWLTQKTGKKEYLDRLEKANSKIIAVCTDYVIMEHSADDSVIQKIIKGACAEDKVSEDDAYSLQSVKAILIKDVVGMRLISDDVKKEIVTKLSEEVSTKNNEKIVEKIILYQDKEKNKVESTLIAAFISFFSGIVAVLYSIIPIMNDYERLIINDSKRIMIVLLISVLLFELLLVAMLLFRGIIKRNSHLYQKNAITKTTSKNANDEKK